jgi:hypothetical protein
MRFSFSPPVCALRWRDVGRESLICQDLAIKPGFSFCEDLHGPQASLRQELMPSQEKAL